MKQRAAFSLIEVNVAILVIAGGLLSLFTLFPAGLRMSSAAMSDTRQALFADDFFAYFSDGVSTIDNRDDWQNIETFWKRGREGLEDGFDQSLDDKDWTADDTVIKEWSTEDKLKKSDFRKGDPNKLNGGVFLRFRNGVIKGYFTDNSKVNTLDAEYLVRIASDYGDNADGLIWRVSLIVSDDGTGGYYYNNPVYHRDFRYAELP